MHIEVGWPETGGKGQPLLGCCEQKISEGLCCQLLFMRHPISLQDGERMVAHNIETGVKQLQRLVLNCDSCFVIGEDQIFIGSNDIKLRWSKRDHHIRKKSATAATKG